MQKYDYVEALKNDILLWLEDEGKTLTDYEDASQLADALWTEDRITGNGSGSYTFDTWTAEECLCHNWDLIAEAAEVLDIPTADLAKGPEYWDVTIRCYLLGPVCQELFEEEEGAQ